MNYRPFSLLPICGKIFERLLYKNIFYFLIENGLVSQNKSEFEPGDFNSVSMHKKMRFFTGISSVNVTKSAGNCGFGDIY